MTVFTTTLGTIVKNGFDLRLDEPGCYPIWDEKYRPILNGKIVEHYYFREIGMETPELFARYLRRRMNEIMPYYVELHNTQLDYDPFSNIDVTTTSTRDTTGNEDRTASHDEDAKSVSDSGTDSTARSLISNTPQMQLSGREDYASNITDNTSESFVINNSDAESHYEDISKVNAKNLEEYVSHISGLQGITKSAALLEVRNLIINIDLMIIDELSDLFMGIYNADYGAFGVI